MEVYKTERCDNPDWIETLAKQFCNTPKDSSDLQLHEKCLGCDRIRFEQLCSMYLEPTCQWTRLGGCAGRTHDLKVDAEAKGKPVFVDPLKASKQAMKAKIKAAKPAATKKQERRDAR